MTTFALRRRDLAVSVDASVSVSTSGIGFTGTTTPPVESTNFIRVKDDFRDGPTSVFSSYILQTRWTNFNGDWRDADNQPQGGHQFGTITVGAGGWPTVWTSDNIKDLVTKWMQSGNTGMWIGQVAGSPLYLMTRRVDMDPGHNWGPEPKLVVTTTTVSNFTCPLLCALGLTNSNGAHDPEFNLNVMNTPCALRWDLSSLSGTVTDARLSLTNVNDRPDAGIIVIHRLDPTLIIDDPATQIGGAITGIASSVTDDNALATHPQMAFYIAPSSDSEVDNNFGNLPPSFKYGFNHSYETWQDINVDHIKSYFCNEQSCERNLRWHLYIQPLDAPPSTLNNAPWRRPYAVGQELGYNELYFRHMLEIDPDGWAGLNEEGIKLSGLESSFDSGFVSPQPSSAHTWLCWWWHGAKSNEHRDIFHLAWYRYHFDHSLQVTSGIGDIKYMNLYPGIFLRTGKRYCLEQYVKMNTFGAGGVPNFDGILIGWVDGVKVHEETTMRWRGAPEVQIQEYKVQSYHGGVGRNPFVPFYHKVGGFALSKAYVGVPKSPIPDWVPPTGTHAEFTHDTVLNDVGQAAQIGTLANWCGGCFCPDASPYGAVAWMGGREHVAYSDYGGMLLLNIFSRRFEWVCRPPHAPHIIRADGTDLWGTDPYGLWGDDGSAQVTHTYNAVQYLPAAGGGGPRGSVGLVARSNGIRPSGQAGTASTIMHDLSVVGGVIGQPFGQTNITNGQFYNFGSGPNATANDGATTSNWDSNHRGFWSTVHDKGGDGNGIQMSLCFTNTDTGLITAYTGGPIKSGLHYAKLYYRADVDLLFMFAGLWDDNLHPVYVTIPPTRAGFGWVPLSIDRSVEPDTYLGYLAPNFCEHPNYNCFVTLEPFHEVNPALGRNQPQVKVWLLHPPGPPATSDWTTGTWTWTSEINNSFDGSYFVSNRYGGDFADSGWINGLFGRLVYSPQVRSLVWVRNMNQRGMLIRLQNMT